MTLLPTKKKTKPKKRSFLLSYSIVISKKKLQALTTSTRTVQESRWHGSVDGKRGNGTSEDGSSQLRGVRGHGLLRPNPCPPHPPGTNRTSQGCLHPLGKAPLCCRCIFAERGNCQKPKLLPTSYARLMLPHHHRFLVWQLSLLFFISLLLAVVSLFIIF